MKYVAELTLTSGAKVYSLTYPMNAVNPVGTAIVLDTEGNAVETMGVRQLDSWSQLGVGAVYIEASGRIVCHTKKTALLHHYIENVRSDYGMPVRDYSVSYAFNTGTMFGYVTPDGKEFRVCTGYGSIDVLGWLGSVVVSHSSVNEREKIYTLYDYLGRLCRESGKNLLIYDTLCIYSESRRITTRIKFSQDAESRRFFTKMFLDISRGDSE